jgi:c-di-GMP-binding flagellar brake protein YcgR
MKKIYLKIKYGKEKSAKGYILDISRQGAGIACAKKIRQNTAIELMPKKDIFLPMRGKIVSIFYREKKNYCYRLGVRFISLQKQNKAKLENFIQKIEKRRAGRLTVL